MDRLLDTFDEIVLSWGNHDARVHKALGYKVSFSKAMRLMFEDIPPRMFDERIVLSDLDHVIIETPRGPYRVAHPKAYNSVPLTTARRLASKHLSHVITGHSHHTALGSDVSGRFAVAEIGGFFDANKVAYLQRTTTYPNWQKGYGFIDTDGYLVVESELWSSRIGGRA
jgi:hypothetical protein